MVRPRATINKRGSSPELDDGHSLEGAQRALAQPEGWRYAIADYQGVPLGRFVLANIVYLFFFWLVLAVCRCSTICGSRCRTVADLGAGGAVIPAIDVTHPGTVQMHADGRLFARVPDALDAALVWQHGRSPFPLLPRPFPGLPQARVVSLRTVVQTLVALFEDGPQGAAVGSPGGVVMNPGPRPRRPNEDLQGGRAVQGRAGAGSALRKRFLIFESTSSMWLHLGEE